MKNKKGPKVLIFDIETSPIEALVWGLFDQNIGLNQIQKDWSILSFAAKWLDEKEIFYADTRNEKDPRNDKKVVQKLHKLISEADILVGQSSDKFDIKKSNARFVYHGLDPISGYRTHDTVKMARKFFGFTSNKLEYMSEHLNDKYTKLKNSGMSLWVRCLEGDLEAFKEMEKYNKQDVLACEELFKKFSAWDSKVNYNAYHAGLENVCSCGSKRIIHDEKRYRYTAVGKFKRLKCMDCGKGFQSKENELTKEKRKGLLK